MNRPLAILTGGGAAVGKTTAIAKLIDRRGLVWIDNDAFCQMLGNRESAKEADREFVQLAIKHDLSFLIDGTLADNERAKGLVSQLKEANYRVFIYFFHCPPTLALVRNRQRVRVLDDEWVLQSSSLALRTCNELRGVVSDVLLYDTSGLEPRLERW